MVPSRPIFAFFIIAPQQGLRSLSRLRGVLELTSA
jgi:hypothetical protein